MMIMDRLTQISERVIKFYAENPPIGRQIMHTQSVAHFTHIISSGDEMLIMAAWLHDIGCPPAIKKYGDSKPPHQEAEGKMLVHEWLDGNEMFSQQEVNWLADAVGGHHRQTEAKRLHFEPLYEADLIVNLFEGYYPMEDARRFVDSGAVSTTKGLELFRILFNV